MTTNTKPKAGLRTARGKTPTITPRAGSVIAKPRSRVVSMPPRFIDNSGEDLTAQQVKAAGLGHLLPDVHGMTCSVCGRKSAERRRGEICLAMQANHVRCNGKFE